MLNNTKLIHKNQIELHHQRAGTTSLVLMVCVAVMVAGAMIVFVILAGRHFASQNDKVRATGGVPGVVINLTPEVKAQQVKPFALTDENGNSFNSTSLAGDCWLVDFIFTNCAGPCPIMTSEMAKIQDDYTGMNNLHFVSISVDPKRDTPSKLKAYGTQYGADFNRWVFLTGDYKIIQRVAQGIFLLAVTNPAQDESKSNDSTPASESIVHSTKLVLVGPDGTIINWFTGTDAEELIRLRKILDGLPEGESRASTHNGKRG